MAARSLRPGEVRAFHGQTRLRKRGLNPVFRWESGRRFPPGCGKFASTAGMPCQSPCFRGRSCRPSLTTPGRCWGRGRGAVAAETGLGRRFPGDSRFPARRPAQTHPLAGQRPVAEAGRPRIRPAAAHQPCVVFSFVAAGGRPSAPGRLRGGARTADRPAAAVLGRARCRSRCRLIFWGGGRSAQRSAALGDTLALLAAAKWVPTHDPSPRSPKRLQAVPADSHVYIVSDTPAAALAVAHVPCRRR
jgi:hypothetical protein